MEVEGEEEILIERNDGWSTVYIETEYGTRAITGLGDNFEARKRGETYKALAERFNLSEECDSDKLPVEVVMHGKSAIAVYLYAVHRRSISDVAEIMDVRPDTVEQYISKARSGWD